jgi:hypothetical protein
MAGGGDTAPEQPQVAQINPEDLFTAFPNPPAMRTIPPGMPGQLETIAQQLGSEFLAYLRNLHQPTTFADFSQTGAGGAGGGGGDGQKTLGKGIPDLFRLTNMPNPQSMPYEQWNTFINNPSRLPFGSYAGMNYQGP